MIFFSNWGDLGRIVLIGVVSYIALVFLLRAAGKRTLSQMNAFDFAVSVAVGSTLSTVIINKNTTLAEGIVAFLVLLGLQRLMGWLSIRSKRFENLLKADPQLLYYNNKYAKETMRRTRISREDIYQAIRSEGKQGTDDIKAVILEADGSLSIIPYSDPQHREALQEVKRTTD